LWLPNGFHHDIAQRRIYGFRNNILIFSDNKVNVESKHVDQIKFYTLIYCPIHCVPICVRTDVRSANWCKLLSYTTIYLIQNTYFNTKSLLSLILIMSFIIHVIDLSFRKKHWTHCVYVWWNPKQTSKGTLSLTNSTRTLIRLSVKEANQLHYLWLW